MDNTKLRQPFIKKQKTFLKEKCNEKKTKSMDTQFLTGKFAMKTKNTP